MQLVALRLSQLLQAGKMTDGQASLTELNYAPLPDEIRTKVDAAIQGILDA